METNTARPYGSQKEQALARLDAGLRNRLILVTAPEGYGKTALLRQWAAALQGAIPVAWVSLEPGCNRMDRFLTQVWSAIHAAGLGDVPVELPGSEMIDLANALAGVEEDFALILDQYHVIYTQVVHAAVSLLLDYPPRGLHIVIACRSEPPLQIPRLRARRQLVELGPSDF
ncbi:MAG: hypothetical protein EHM70_23630 [Chloroflexota bacterium]|nr:MAG: hypothetical protein EHM70_23630 [Chloroflexota bacterium]